MGKKYKIEISFLILLLGFTCLSTSLFAQGGDDLKKQLKTQSKVAGKNDGSSKASKYDKIESDKKRDKFFKDSKKKGKVKLSNKPTQFKTSSSAPPAKNPVKTRAEAAKKNRSVGKVRDVPDGEKRNATTFKASSSAPPAKNPVKTRAEAAKKNRSVGKVRDVPDGEKRNATTFKASSSAPPAKNPAKTRAEAAKKNRSVGKVRDIPDGEKRNATQLKATSAAPPAKNPAKTRAEAAKKNRSVGKVRDIPDGEKRNSTQLKATSAAPPAKNPAKTRAEAAKKNRSVGTVRDIPDGERRNSTQLKTSSAAPPAKNPVKTQAEAAKKNRTVGMVRDIPDGERRNATQIKASAAGPPPVDRKKIRTEAAKKNRTVGAVKDMTDSKMRNSTQLKETSAAPPARNPAKTRAEAAKKNETIGQSTKEANYVKKNKNSNMKAKERAGMVPDYKDDDVRNPTVFKSTASERISAPSPRARKAALKDEIEKNSGDIKQSDRDAWIAKRNYKSSQAGHYEGAVEVKQVNKNAKNKEDLRNSMEKNSGDIKQSDRDAWLQKRSHNSAQAGNYTGSVKRSDVADKEKSKENLRDDMEKYGTGDISVKTREDQYALRKQKSEEAGNYTGSVKMKLVEQRAKQKEDLKKDMEKYGTGDISLKTRENQYELRKQKSEEMANYTGSVKMSVVEARNKKREDLKKDMEKYGTGDISLKTRENQYALRKAKSEEMANYTGSVKMSVVEARAKKKEDLRKEMSKYSTGDIKLSDLEKRAKARRVKSREMASYSGTFKVRDIEKHQKNIRRKTSDIANYEGDIKIQRRKKGVHPSVMYRQGWNNDRKKRDKLRRKMLKKSRRKGDLEKPNYLKKDLPKPGYDPREAEIWYK